MADDDKDFTFGKVDEDFSSDDKWGKREHDFGGPGENDEDFALGADENIPAGPVTIKKAPAPRDEEPTSGGRNSSLMMISGALVMILSAVGFYYFTTSPSPPAAVQRPAPGQPAVVISQPPEPAAPGEAVPVVPLSTGGPVTVEPSTSKPVPKEDPPAKPVPATPKATRPEMSIPIPPAPPVEFKPSKKSAPPSTKAVAAKPSITKPATTGAFVVQAGAFADSGNRDEALAKLRELGYEGKTAPITLTKPMTRLLVGVYPEAVARQKLQDLSRITPTAFSLRQGQQLAIYAGSFQSSAMARGITAHLARKGIKTTEETKEATMTLWRLTLPGFTDRETAEAAARRIRTTGLDAKVFQNPR